MKIRTFFGALIAAVTGILATELHAQDAGKTFASLIDRAAYLKGGAAQYTAFVDSDLRVIRVTNLNADGEGSLAWAARQKGPRTVVFEVGGVIDMKGTELKIHEPFLYIAGQTAPDPGITLVGGSVSIQSHDIIIRHIAVRPGDRDQMKQSGWDADGMTTYKAYNVLVDHCSITWATDEGLSVSGPRHDGRDKTSHDITFSNNIIAESLSNSTHSKGEHSKGMLIHDYCTNIALVGNLYASNLERNPLLKPNAVAYMANNVIYNPKRRAVHAAKPDNEYAACPDSMRRATLAAIGNVLIPGPDTPVDFWLLFGWMSAYHKDNMITTSAADTKGERKRRIVNNQVEVLTENPVPAPNYQTIPVSDIAATVLARVGMRPAERDATDARLIAEVKTGTGRVIDSQEEVGGYPEHAATRRALTIPSSGIEPWLEAQAAAVTH